MPHFTIYEVLALEGWVARGAHPTLPRQPINPACRPRKAQIGLAGARGLLFFGGEASETERGMGWERGLVSLDVPYSPSVSFVPCAGVLCTTRPGMHHWLLVTSDEAYD